MKVICRISNIELPPDARGRLVDKLAIGEVVQYVIKGEAYIHPSISIVPTSAKITIKEGRSFKELGTYWWVCKWLELNTPEHLEKQFGIFSNKVWHEHLKGRYGITSIAFENMEQDEFHKYFLFVADWLRTVFDVDIKDVIEVMSTEKVEIPG